MRGGHTLTMGYTSLGEIARRQRADGMTTLYKHDTERRVVYEGDPGKGIQFWIRFRPKERHQQHAAKRGGPGLRRI